MRQCVFCGASPTLEYGKRASCARCYKSGLRAKRGRKAQPRKPKAPRLRLAPEQRAERKRTTDKAARQRPHIRQRARERHQRWKQRAMEILGPACLRCGFDDPRALVIDHVADDGKSHRAELGKSWKQMSKWVVLHHSEAVQRVQMLCANCNTIKAVHWLERRRKAA